MPDFSYPRTAAADPHFVPASPEVDVWHAPALLRRPGLFARLLGVTATWKVALFALLWFGTTTGLYPLLLPDEGRYVGVAWSMLSGGDLLVPRLDGMPFFHKPPLFYWFTAAFLSVFGPNEWAARLTSVVAATALVAGVFWFLKTWAGQRAAIVTAVILGTMPFLFGASHYANLDMTVATLIAFTIMFAASALLRQSCGLPWRWYLMAAYGMAGLGFLAKGLIGLVLPAGVLVFWLLASRRFESILRLISVPGILVTLLVSLPWMLAMQAAYPDFFRYYIVYQHFERFAETGFNNPHPFWFYVPVLVGLALPWSLQLYPLLKGWRRNRMHRESRAGNGGRDRVAPGLDGLMLSWLVTVVVFFSIPESKLIGYILPALAPFAWFLARPFLWRARRDPGGSRRALTKYLVVSCGIAVAAVATMVAVPAKSSKSLAMQLRTSMAPQDQLVMLNTYRFDVPFYLRRDLPIMVAEDWNDPNVQRDDTWRKEIHDAGRFDPDRARERLILPRDLHPLACGSGPGALWIVGESGSVDRYPFLARHAAMFSKGTLRVWRIERPAQGRSGLC